jgi:diguanylate cyclase (GGDEF)-like protein/PAS domain S-box-containing protein
MAQYGQQLIANLAIVALFISAWGHGNFVLSKYPRLWRNAAFGLVMGLAAAASMMLAVPIGDAIFDLRLSVIAIAGFFGGPIAGLIAAALAIAYRVSIGGSATVIATAGIVFVSCGSIVVSRLSRERVPALAAALFLALMVAAATLSMTIFTRAIGLSHGHPLSMTIVVLNAVATLVAAFFLMRHRGLERERDLLRAAFLQSPDVQYIKTPESRFVAVNGVLAKSSGYDDPHDLVGKMDADILQPDSAAAIVADDQQIIATGIPKIDFEELVHSPTGDDIWYLTSKVPLRDIDGDIIGIAGWTRDETARKRLEREVVQSRNQLNHVLTEMSDGIAMFDSQGTLIYRNNQYGTLFPLTNDIRRPGQHIRDILREVMVTGEQVIPEGREEEWLEKIVTSMDQVSEEDVELFNGRWLHLRTRPTADGAALVMVTDVTTIKQAETRLLAMTEQLKMLATTDGLTGLTNRRAFDAALEMEIARSRRDGTPLSLLMIDVDHFKIYNDIYGHQGGDDVLKKMGASLRQAMRRPGDVAARYGGEEFVAILPDTDEDGAFFIAESLRESIRSLGLPHKGADAGIVTVSVGLATTTAHDKGMTSSELLGQADRALYEAKAAGRNRVMGRRESPMSAMRTG